MPLEKASADFVHELERRIRAEKVHGLDRLEKQWARPILERVRACRAIGPLTLLERIKVGKETFIHFDPSADDIAMFREGDRLRLSQNDPDGLYHEVIFHGLTAHGLTVSMRGAPLAGDRGWTLDEDFFDLSPYYLKGLESLKSNQNLIELLSGGEVPEDFDGSAFDDLSENLGNQFNDSQVDAIAISVASSPIHIVQGPPGTGKTHVLAQTVVELVRTNQRILVTAFTHRAIHHALRKIRPLVSCPVFKISDDIPHDNEGIEFRENFAATGLIDNDGPYVLGITPISLFTSRADAAFFDIALIDETSQMRVEAAILPMLRAKRWVFYGDQQQLPPVCARPVEDPKHDSIFVQLMQRKSDFTMLRETYRMNGELSRWPSENFYGGELEASAFSRFQTFKSRTTSEHPALQPEPSLLRMEIDHHGCKAVSNEEADAVLTIVEECLNSGVTPSDIGVVVPFRAQAANIRRALRFDRFRRFPGIRDIAIDTVERFQGQEREVILISFTVSDYEFLSSLADFLTYPQRINVAVTRARTKAVVIHSKSFRRYLETHATTDENAALVLSLFKAANPIDPWQG